MKLSSTVTSPRFNELQDWLDWMETLHPKEIELGLERVTEVAVRLGLEPLIEPRTDNDQPLPKVISVAGTNGKGSCVAALEALLLETDVSVGCYSSPHLLRYNERVKINGKVVTDAMLCDAFAIVDSARKEISLTYFEFGTLAAFHLFQRAGLDYWVLEIGLGGRLDAVNCLAPDIAVITSVALDHESWLGADREIIGYEKAGILRAGIPFVCADNDPPTTITQAARSLGVRYLQLGRDYRYSQQESTVSVTLNGGASITLTGAKLPLPSLVAAMQVFCLLGYAHLLASASACLASLSVTGRFSFHRSFTGQLLLLDVAHNPAAAVLLAQRLQALKGQSLVAVVAMMADKDIFKTLRPLVPHVRHWYPLALSEITRAATPDIIQGHLRSLNVDADRISPYSNFSDILLEVSRVYPRATVLVFGSFYTVAAALEMVEEVNNG